MRSRPRSSSACARAIESNGGEAAPKPLLLHGVTGSGKTEIYLQAIHLVLERKQTAIMLVPEISLTPQTVERFKSRFAATQHEVAVLHSHLSRRRAPRRVAQDPQRPRAHRHRRAQRGLCAGAKPRARSWWMRSTRIPTSRRRRRATTGAMWRSCAPAWRSAPCCSARATPSLESFHNAHARQVRAAPPHRPRG